MKNKFKIFILPFFALISLQISAVSAQSIVEGDDTWTEVSDYRDRIEIDSEFDVTQLTNSIKDELMGFVEGLLGGIAAEIHLTELNQDISAVAGDIKTFLSDLGKEADIGELGIPNIQEARKIFTTEAVLSELNDILGGQTGGTYNSGIQLHQQYLKNLAQEFSENSALSLEGQSKIEAKIDSMISSAQQSIDIAEDSSGQDVSQNIMRNMSNQSALSLQANAMMFADRQEEAIRDSLGLQISSEALIELSETNTARERQDTAANSAALQSLSLISIPGYQN